MSSQEPQGRSRGCVAGQGSSRRLKSLTSHFVSGHEPGCAPVLIGLVWHWQGDESYPVFLVHGRCTLYGTELLFAQRFYQW